MNYDDYRILEEKYSKMFPDKNDGSITAGALEFSFGYEHAGEILEEAIRKDCRIKIVNCEGEDNVEKIMFVKRK